MTLYRTSAPTHRRRPGAHRAPKPPTFWDQFVAWFLRHAGTEA